MDEQERREAAYQIVEQLLSLASDQELKSLCVYMGDFKSEGETQILKITIKVNDGAPTVIVAESSRQTRPSTTQSAGDAECDETPEAKN